MFDGIKVLVTGCSGFLGPWLCQRLVEASAFVVGGDIQFDSHSRIHEVKNGIKLVELDVEDLGKIENVLEQYEIEFVFHLAAQSLVGKALEQPLHTISTNIMGTTNVLEAARRMAQTARALTGIVVASSDKAYGDQEQQPYVEAAPMMGRFPYDVSKSCADLIARSYVYSYGLPVSVVRCGNLYGAGDLNWSRIVPGTIRSLLKGERPIVRSDGTLVRDYIYVEDAAEAMMIIGSALLNDDTIYGEAFNISAGRPLSVLEVVDAIQKVAKSTDLPALVENTARGEIQTQCLSPEKVKAKLGWEAKTELNDGLARAVEWYRMRCDV